MSFRKLARSLALIAWVPFALSACGGASFDDPAKIKGLRVLAVQKSAPYPKPDELVNLKLLFWDGKSTEEDRRNIFVFISPVPCENPPGDLYYNCFADLRDGGGNMPDGGDMPDGDAPDGGASAAAASNRAPTDLRLPAGARNRPSDSPGFIPLPLRGDTPFGNMAGELVRATPPESGPQDVDHVRQATVHISRGIIKDRAPGVQPYGLAYVLFMACAGTPRPVTNAGPNKLPFGCFDAEGRELGADDFVIGYTSMYVFETRVNNNPVIDDFLLDATSLTGSTTDANLVPHIPSCKESERSNCPKHTLRPMVNRALSVEKDDDPTAISPEGQQLDEQSWVNYYITAGDLKSSVRLVNDATRGWNEKHEAEYTAPAEPGPVRVFAVVHDNRGGIAWVEGKIIVD